MQQSLRGNYGRKKEYMYPRKPFLISMTCSVQWAPMAKHERHEFRLAPAAGRVEADEGALWGQRRLQYLC